MDTWDQFRKLLPEARREKMAGWTAMETVEMERRHLYKVYFGVRADSIIEYEARGKGKSKRYLVLVTGL